MKYLVGLLCLMLCGCSSEMYTYHVGKAPTHIIHPKYIPIWMQDNFDVAQKKEIKDAATEWNYVFNGQVVLDIQHKTFADFVEGAELVKEAENDAQGWILFDLKSDDPNLGDVDGTLAFVTGTDHHFVVVIGDHLGNRSLKDIMMHEMAHLLGASHVNTASLEYPYYSKDQVSCIDKITVLQVAQIQRLDFKTLNYCITPNLE